MAGRWLAVVFDLDDTLYPEREFVCGGYRAVGAWTVRKWGVDISSDLLARFESGERGDLFTPCLQVRGICPQEDDVLALVEIYREHPPRLAPFPDIPPALDRLRKAGLRMGLISDGYWQVQISKWRALGLERFFDDVIFTDAFGRAFWKPHPRPYQEMLRLLAVPPEQVVYIGDNPQKDFIGARRCGMHTLRLRRPQGLHAAVDVDSEHAADVVLTDAAAVTEYLLS